MWLPEDFPFPRHVDLPTGHHLRPIRETDVDIDLPAVMGSQARLWSIFGEAWGWPPATMTHEQDRVDLARHEREIEARQSFNYAVLPPDEAAVLGCIYIDPPAKVGADAEVCWWVVDDLVGSDLDRALEQFVPDWLGTAWPFERVCHIGRDLTWAEWLARPDTGS
ncbi:MAG: N-acetyltransferase [Acidimicrobiales bacterium]